MMTVQILVVLLLSLVAVELGRASSGTIRRHSKVTEQVVVQGLSLGLVVVCVRVLWLQIFARFLF